MRGRVVQRDCEPGPRAQAARREIERLSGDIAEQAFDSDQDVKAAWLLLSQHVRDSV
jgi:hypothetical protein